MHDLVLQLASESKNLMTQEKHQEAFDLLRDMSAESINLLASMELKRKNNQRTIQLLEMCILINPKSWVPYSNFAHIYCSLKNYDEAKKFADRSIELANDVYPDPYYNRAIVSLGEKKVEEAISYFEKALKVDPNHNLAKFNMGSCFFMLNRMEEGWRAYELRSSVFTFVQEFKNHFKKPEWDGIQSLKGKKILVYSEQGVGDAIQHIRFLPRLKEKGAYIILEIQSAMKELLEDRKYIDQLLTRDTAVPNEKLPHFHYIASINSLPYLLKLKNSDISCPIPYLKAKNKKVVPKSFWEEYKNKLKIGICWAGSAIHKSDYTRSLQVKFFKIFDRPEVQMFAFKNEDPQRSWITGDINLLEDVEEINIIDLSADISSFNDTANILKNIDLVITVDTSLAHLCGALGKPTWVMLPDTVDCRWGLDQPTTPWYPTFRLFRQGDSWHKTFEEANKELSKLIYNS